MHRPYLGFYDRDEDRVNDSLDALIQYGREQILLVEFFSRKDLYYGAFLFILHPMLSR
jgi:hypothetical protein